MLEVKSLCAGYDGNDVIHNISFDAKPGESLCILGPNGCGKSTLLKSIARIIDFRGKVTLDGCDISSLPRKTLAKKIALMEQSSSVFFPYTVYETVAMGRYAWSEGFLKNMSAKDNKIIDDIIEKLDIGGIRNRMIDELSGGQLQRVFLAKTLAQTPDVILLDEPTNHLDLKYQLELLRHLKLWIRENNKILIGVFHDLNLARHFAGAAIVMNNGKVTARGSTEEALNDKTLQEVYGIDVSGFMRQSLEKWK